MLITARTWTFGVLAAAVFGTLALQLRTQSKLRREISAKRASVSDFGRNQAEKVRLKQEQISDQDIARLRADRAALMRLKAEVTELEQSRQQATAGVAPAQTDPGNRDPAKGPVALEFLENAGRNSPGATLQTILWAAARGDDDILASAVTMSEASRVHGEAIVASLPEAERLKYPTPEKLWALCIAPEFQKWKSLQLSGETIEDATHATVRFRTGEMPEREDGMPMELGTGGWQAVIPEPHMKAMERLLSPTLTGNPVYNK